MKILKIKYLILVLVISLFTFNIVFADDINLNDFNIYKDERLKLKFTYPEDWGKIETQYNDNIGYITDYFVADSTYDVNFTKATKFILAEGETPIGILEEIYDTPVAELCNSLNLSKDSIFFSHITACEKKNNIITFFSSPKYEIYCGDPGNKYLIRKIVTVDLFDNDFMNVLTIHNSFLSSNLQKELTDIVEENEGCIYEGDDGYEEISEKFNDKVDEILSRIQSGDIDAETKQNLADFDAFANSIEDWRAFENWPDWAWEGVTWALNNNILDSDETVLEKVDSDSFKYTLAKMLYSYHINKGGEKYSGEILTGTWPSWADESVSWAINQKIFDSVETVSQKVSEKDFKYMLATMLYRYYMIIDGYQAGWEKLEGDWPDWANDGVSFAVYFQNGIIDTSETVMQPVSEEAFKYTLAVMLLRFDLTP